MRVRLPLLLVGVLASCSRTGLDYGAHDVVPVTDGGGADADAGDGGDARIDAASCVAPAATVLAQSTQQFTSWTTLAQDDLYLYWCAQHSGTFDILRISKCGGPIETVQANIAGYPYSMVIDATTAYFTATGPVLASVPKAGGTVSTLYTSGFEIVDLAIDANVLYFDEEPNTSTQPYDREIRSIPTAGGQSTLITTGYAGVVVDPNWIYTSLYTPENLRLVALPKGGGTPTDLAAFGAPIAVDSSGVYYATEDILTNEGYVNLVRVGVPSKQIANNLAKVFAIALDADFFYTIDTPVNGSGSIKQWAKTGGMGTPLAATPNPHDLLVDATSVYWIDQLSILMKQDKP